MNYLSIENLSKSFGVRKLFQNVSFGIDRGQRVALVARNGTGKSTLMKIISSKDTADSGNVTFRKGVKVGFLDQDPIFDETKTVSETIFQGDTEIISAIKAYEECINNNADGDAMQAAFEKMDELNAWDYETKIEQILSKFKITKLDQLVGELSGGQKKRLALSKLLVEEPELFILDEPTNHLDFEMIEWLEGYLSKQNVTLLMVTHDRYFLDNICNEIIEMEGGNLYSYKGNYAYFLEKKSEREFNEGRETDKARNLMRKELEWIRRMPKARGTKSKSRVDAFYDLEDKAKGKKSEKDLELNVKMSRIGGKILELNKVNKKFDKKTILNGFDYTFKTGDRIGIVGKNGVGKTTFLNIITGKDQPDTGDVSVGETIVYGYYSQEGLKINEEKRVIDVVKDIAEVIPLGDGSKMSASQFLLYFQFTPEQQYTFVSKLSGGEKRRLYLLTVLIKNPNFLILDEPTNDLDILTLNTLEEFLTSFGGCLIIVSHDRYFMDKLVDHLFVFEGEGKIRDFPGNYTDYREALKNAPKNELEEKVKVTVNEPITKETIKQNKVKKLSFNEKKEFDQLESEIAKLEKEKVELESMLSKDNLSNDEIQNKSNRIGQVIDLIDAKTLRWLELEELSSEN